MEKLFSSSVLSKDLCNYVSVYYQTLKNVKKREKEIVRILLCIDTQTIYIRSVRLPMYL